MKEYDTSDDRMNSYTCPCLLWLATGLSLSQARTHFIVTAAWGGWVLL